MLTLEEILRYDPGPLGRDITLCETTASTHADLVKLAKKGAPHGKVLIADHQTSGRGRLGRTWFSPSGTNIYMSVLIRPPGEDVTSFPPLALVAGLSVVEALASVGHGSATVKWPNDVLIKGRKVCGILTEAVITPTAALAVGVGLNVNQIEFPEHLESLATSLRLELGVSQKRSPIVAALLRHLARRFEQAFTSRTELDRVLECWTHHSATIGKFVRAPDGTAGWAESVDSSGALLVRDDHDELHSVLAGPLQVIGPLD